MGDSDITASSLLSPREQKKQERWVETVDSIDFLHSSRKVWNIYKHTGRSGCSSHLAPSQQTASPRNLWGAGHTGPEGHKSSRIIIKKLSDLWKIPKRERNSISGLIRPEELAAALRHLKPEKYLGLDSIFPEFIPHAGSALKFWFGDFLTSCMCHLKFQRTGEKR